MEHKIINPPRHTAIIMDGNGRRAAVAEFGQRQRRFGRVTAEAS